MMILRQRSLGWALVHGLLFVLALYFLVPLYVMIVASFKSLDEILHSSIVAMPMVWTTAGWEKAWSSACTGLVCTGIRPYFIETMVILFPAMSLAIIIGAVNGYLMSFWRSKSADILFGSLIVGSFIPLQLFLIPLAVTMQKLGIFGSAIGLILIHTVYGVPLTTMLYRNFYITLPGELVKAAVVDGAGIFKIFRSIIVPMSAPITIVAVILVFGGIYNDYIFALTFGETGKRPIMAAVLNIISTQYAVAEHNVNMAAVMISALPTLLIFLVAGKFFVMGLAQGSVKG
jgi:glucose/mannose transport system permease protein